MTKTIAQRELRNDKARVIDAVAARSYGQIVAAVAELGRSHRTRITDLLIAATAHANRLRLYTRNPLDFGGLGGLSEMIAI